MTLIAVPLNPLRLNNRTAKTLLDGMLTIPNIFPIPGSIEERRVLIASVLSDPLNRVWLVWNSGALIGCLLLTHVVPRIDALCHFVFFDRLLYGRRTLIWNLMGKVFRELNLQRLSVEVPEHLTPLYRFARNKLRFKLEGEDQAGAHPLVTSKLQPYVKDGVQWVARLGSRRERAFYLSDTNVWVDCIRLRLLRSEYESIGR